jgi:hypothetical protein
LAVWKDRREKSAGMMHAAKETMVAGDGAPGGFAGHETGTARMGTDPRASVLNPHCQAHDMKNLFVVDGSCLTTFRRIIPPGHHGARGPHRPPHCRGNKEGQSLACLAAQKCRDVTS